MAMVDLLETYREGIVTLTFNRPAKRNAMSLDMLAAMAETLNRHALDPLTRVLILTGAGDAFCAGVMRAPLRKTSCANFPQLDVLCFQNALYRAW